MIIRIITFLAGLLPLLCIAQPPQFSKTGYNAYPSKYYIFWPFDTTYKSQCIYYPGDFAAMPPGIVKSIYFRQAALVTPLPDTIVSKDVSIKIGYTSDSTFHYNGWDTFKTGLTPLYYSASHTFICGDTDGKWIRFPCTGNWAWNGTGMFVVEISWGNPISHGPIQGYNGLMAAVKTMPRHRLIGSLGDSLRVYTAGRPNDSTTEMVHDLGFDIAGVGVEALSDITSFGVFPNPCTDGRFNVSFHARQPISEATLTLTNTIGQAAMERQYRDIGTNFFKEIGISGLAKGVYFLELTVDQERLIRRLVVQ